MVKGTYARRITTQGNKFRSLGTLNKQYKEKEFEWYSTKLTCFNQSLTKS